MHGFTGDFVIYGQTRDLVHCAVGLGVLLFWWKPTFFRVGIIWINAMVVATMILLFSYISGENEAYFTTSYWIFSVLIACAWGLGTGTILAVLDERLLGFLVKGVYLSKMKARKREKRRKKRRKKKK